MNVLIEKAAKEIYPQRTPRFDESNQTGGDCAYHYLGSAIWFNSIGHSVGETMLELLKNQN
jgi:hypothetical protein